MSDVDILLSAMPGEIIVGLLVLGLLVIFLLGVVVWIAVKNKWGYDILILIDTLLGR